MEKSMSRQDLEFAEKFMGLVDMEVTAHNVLELSITTGNREMEVSAREALQRIANEIAALLHSGARHRYANC